MNKGRQNQPLSKKGSKRRMEPEASIKKKEVAKESPMQVEAIPEQQALKFERPIELIDEAFIELDKVSRMLNEPGARGVSEQGVEELRGVIERVGQFLPLEQLHNLQYSNRLSYIVDVSQRKCSKGKNIAALVKLADAQLQRVELLYQKYFADITFLEQIRHQYLGASPQV